MKTPRRRPLINRPSVAGHKPSVAFLRSSQRLFAVVEKTDLGELVVGDVSTRSEAREIADWFEGGTERRRDRRFLVREVKIALASAS